MEQTPRGMRKHVALIGHINAGKSSLFNALLGYNEAIISQEEGTTTDPIHVSMELLPFGPITLIDTAGFGDHSALGEKRIQKTNDIFRRIDLALLVIDASSALKMDIPMDFGFSGDSLLIFNKKDLITDAQKNMLQEKYSEATFVSINDLDSIIQLKQKIYEALDKQTKNESKSMIKTLLPKGANVILVIPIDSEAPAGRLILPQVQFMRDLLDNEMKGYITRETTFQDALDELKHIDLVVTDSQIFKYVNEQTSKHIPLTSFSMLLAYQKGNFKQQKQGALSVEKLKEGDRVLILEGCKHNQTHEDIGRVKIPQLLQMKTNCQLNFDFYQSYSMPDNITQYALAIQCGSCMLSRAEVQYRLRLFQSHHIPVSNYGMILAYANGILERSCEIFQSMT